LRYQVIDPARILPDRGAAAGTGARCSSLSLPGTNLAQRRGTGAPFVCGVPGITCARHPVQVHQPETLFAVRPYWHPNCFDSVQTENGLAARSSMIR